MPTLETFALCEGAAIDQKSSNLSMFNVVEGVEIGVATDSDAGSGMAHIKMFFVTRWLYEAGEDIDAVRLQLFAIGPSDRRGIWKHEQPFPKFTQQVVRIVLETGGVPVSGPGRHFIEARLLQSGRRPKTVGRISYQVTLKIAGAH